MSTSVLPKEPDTISAVVNIVNLNSHCSQFITVEVWDCSSYDDPTELTVYFYYDVKVPFPYKIYPDMLTVMYANLGQLEDDQLFEIRIICTAYENLIINCFGRSIPPYESQECNTVYN